MISKDRGMAYVFTYPYWIYVDPKNPPEIIEFKLGNNEIRLFPPFRVAPWNSINMPRLEDKMQIPFPPNKSPNYDEFKIVPCPIGLPHLDENGKVSTLLYGTNPDGDSRIPPNSLLPKDAIRIDLYCDDAEQSGMLANQINRKLMEILRWRTNQCWITRSTHGLSHFGAIDFQINKVGRFIKNRAYPSGETAVRTFNGDEKYLNRIIWKQVADDLTSETQAPIHELLLLDARYSLSINDLRQAVLDGAGACDFLKENICEELWLRKYPGKRYDRTIRDGLLQGWKLPRHIDKKFRDHFGRSYKTEHPIEWDSINDLWSARDNVAHGQPAEFGNPPILVDEELLKKFLEAATHCVSWLQGI